MTRRAVVIALLWAACAARRARARPDGAPTPGSALDDARRSFDALAQEAAALPPNERILFVNVAVNRRIDYVDDALGGDADVWRTPLESLADGRGDCEDIAIAKFFLLLAAGVDPSAVRLLYAHYRDLAVPGLEIPHIVAIARIPFDDPMVLDNLNLIVLPLSQRSDLQPLFSFDRVHLWHGVDGTRHGDARAQLPPWRRVLERIAAQGQERSE